jgi:hypothetical protein
MIMHEYTVYHSKDKRNTITPKRPYSIRILLSLETRPPALLILTPQFLHTWPHRHFLSAVCRARNLLIQAIGCYLTRRKTSDRVLKTVSLFNCRHAMDWDDIGGQLGLNR